MSDSEDSSSDDKENMLDTLGKGWNSPGENTSANSSSNRNQSAPNLVQSRAVKKGDRVTFYNDKKNCWMNANITSAPIKYYRKRGPYHKLVTDSGLRGGHYFLQNGLWSILTEENLQLPDQTADSETYSNDSMVIEDENIGVFLNEEYEDQMELSFVDQLDLSFENIQLLRTVDEQTFYPSAASFPDLDIQVPRSPPPLRDRQLSVSEPELQSISHLRQILRRMQKWKSALSSAWSYGGR